MACRERYQARLYSQAHKFFHTGRTTGRHYAYTGIALR